MGQRNKMIMDLFYRTGIRKSELINLKDKDVDIKNMTIKVHGKRDKERLIPFTRQFIRQIQEFRATRDLEYPQHHEFFFVGSKGTKLYDKEVYRIVHKYLSLVTSITKKSPHVIRHTFATHMLNHGADLNAIKEILGHANLAATQVYTHNSFEKLKSVYKKAHPRA
jgi:integrase/recombinase XerC